MLAIAITVLLLLNVQLTRPAAGGVAGICVAGAATAWAAARCMRATGRAAPILILIPYLAGWAVMHCTGIYCLCDHRLLRSMWAASPVPLSGELHLPATTRG